MAKEAPSPRAKADPFHLRSTIFRTLVGVFLVFIAGALRFAVVAARSGSVGRAAAGGESRPRARRAPRSHVGADRVRAQSTRCSQRPHRRPAGAARRMDAGPGSHLVRAFRDWIAQCHRRGWRRHLVDEPGRHRHVTTRSLSLSPAEGRSEHRIGHRSIGAEPELHRLGHSIWSRATRPAGTVHRIAGGHLSSRAAARLL